MFADSKLQEWAQSVNRRKSHRVQIALKGKLFIIREKRELDCVVTDLSPGGAGICCKASPPRKTEIVLYIGGFGRFEGTTTQPTKDGTGIRFKYTARKRKRIADQLELFVKEGLTAVTFLRESERIRDVTIQNFTRLDGEVVDCEILDISLTGTLLKTVGRPPINEVIRLGRIAGRVVRHHEGGIGVHFIGEA
jgi:hypothetical protein